MYLPKEINIAKGGNRNLKKKLAHRIHAQKKTSEVGFGSKVLFLYKNSLILFRLLNKLKIDELIIIIFKETLECLFIFIYKLLEFYLFYTGMRMQNLIYLLLLIHLHYIL